MDASNVYMIAKALPQDELTKLYNMLKKDILEVPKIKKARKKLPDFTVNDAFNNLLDIYLE